MSPSPGPLGAEYEEARDPSYSDSSEDDEAAEPGYDEAFNKQHAVPSGMRDLTERVAEQFFFTKSDSWLNIVPR